MNKTDLVSAMAAEGKMTKVSAKKSLETLLSAATKALKKGEKISLVGFGNLTVVKRAARSVRNPQNGKMLKVAAKKVVKFKPGTALKAKINK